MGTFTLGTPILLANGYQMTFNVAAGTCNGTVTTDPTKISIALTSEGYNSSGVLGTISRTITIVSATVSASTLTCNLSEPIYNDDTAVSVTLQAAAFTDVTPDTSDALGSTSVDIATTPSTLDYPTPTGHVWCEPSAQWARVVSSFKVRAAAIGAPLAGSSNCGIKCAELTITDAGAAHTQTIRVTSWTQIARQNTNGLNTYYPAFEFTVDPGNCDGGGTDFATGWATLSVAFKPYCGDAASIATATTRVYLAPGGTAVPYTGYIDTTSTLGIAAGTGSDFTGWNYIKGDTGGVIGILVGTQSGSSLLITVLNADANGVPSTFTNGETISEYSDYACTTLVGAAGKATLGNPVVITHNGDDTTGALDTRTSPYRTAMEFFDDAEVAGGGAVSGCRAKVLRGAFRLGPYTAGNAFSSANGVCVIEPYDGAAGGTAAVSAGTTADTARLLGRGGAGDGGFDSEGMRTQYLRLTGWYGMIRSGTVPWSTAAPGSGADAEGEFIVFDNNTIIGPGRGDTTITAHFNAFEGVYVAGCSLDACWEGMRGGSVVVDADYSKGIVVDCNYTNIGQDMWSSSTASQRIVVNSYGQAYRDSGAGAHSGMWQIGTAGTMTNLAIWCSAGICKNSSAGPFSKQSNGGTLNRAGQFACYWDVDDASNNSRIEGGTVTNLFDIAVSKSPGYRLVESATSAFSNVYIYNSVFADFGYDLTDASTTLVPYEAWWINNHNIATTTGGGTITRPVGYQGTTGSGGGDTEFDALFSSRTPTSATILDRLASTPQYPRDATGRLLSTDSTATAAIGAYQPTPVLTVTYDGASVSDGGTVTETAGTKSLVMSAATGPTGSVVYISSVALGGTVTGTDASPYTLTSGGSTQSGTISTSLTAGAATVDITYDLGSIFDFDITGQSAGGGFRSRARSRKR